MKKLLLLGVIFMSSSELGLTVSSLDFRNNGTIPKEFTCNEDGNAGSNKIPKLVWEGAPAKTKSFVLICDDPDAPGGAKNPWVHWVVYNIPPNKMSSDYITDKREKFTDGTLQGKNSWPRVGYDGPCPPPGKPHRYHFTLYAIDSMLPLEPGATKEQVEKAMKGHILAHAIIIGLYGQ